MNQSPCHPGRGDPYGAQRLRLLQGGAGRNGSESSSARSAGWPGATVPSPSVLAARASRAVSACSGCHGARSSALRWTAAATASQGSSGETGASDPNASSTPSSCSQRNAKHRSVRSGQKLSVRSRSSSRCAGWTLARMPSAAIWRESSRVISCACSIDPVAPVSAYAASASATAASPIACTATVRWCRLACRQQVAQPLAAEVRARPSRHRWRTANNTTPCGCSTTRPR